MTWAYLDAVNFVTGETRLEVPGFTDLSTVLEGWSLQVDDILYEIVDGEASVGGVSALHMRLPWQRDTFTAAATIIPTNAPLEYLWQNTDTSLALVQSLIDRFAGTAFMQPDQALQVNEQGVIEAVDKSVFLRTLIYNNRVELPIDSETQIAILAAVLDGIIGITYMPGVATPLYFDENGKITNIPEDEPVRVAPHPSASLLLVQAIEDAQTVYATAAVNAIKYHIRGPEDALSTDPVWEVLKVKLDAAGDFSQHWYRADVAADDPASLDWPTE